jgi:hypothetical protein
MNSIQKKFEVKTGMGKKKRVLGCPIHAALRDDDLLLCQQMIDNGK